PGWVGTRDAHHHVRAPVGGLEVDRVVAHLGEQAHHVLGGLPLTGSGPVAVVGGVDPDQLAADGHRIELGGGGRTVLVSHECSPRRLSRGSITASRPRRSRYEASGSRVCPRESSAYRNRWPAARFSPPSPALAASWRNHSTVSASSTSLQM